MGIFNEIPDKFSYICLVCFGILFVILGIYIYITAKRERFIEVSFLGIIIMFGGIFFLNISIVNSYYLTNYIASNKDNLISVNAENTQNEKVIMKFKESDNSIKEITVPVKEKFTKDKKKHNKYSLKEIKGGYVIYYIAEDVDIPSNPTLEYFNRTKPLANVVKE